MKKFYLAFLIALMSSAVAYGAAEYDNEYVAPEIPEPLDYYYDSGSDFYYKIMDKKSTLTELENRAKDVKSVVRKYFFMSDSEQNRVIKRHAEISRMKSKKNALEAYSRLVSENKYDYFSAYMAGVTSKEMGRLGRAKGWLEYCLNINDKYMPAKQLLKTVNANM